MKELLGKRKEAKDSMTRDTGKGKGKAKQRYLLISEQKRQNFCFFTLQLLDYVHHCIHKLGHNAY